MTLLTGDACRALERIVQDDLEHATVSSASVHVDDVGRIIVEELVLQLEDGRMVTLMPLDVSAEVAVDLRLDIYDDRLAALRADRSGLAGGHGWREATVLVDYAEELADATRVWHPEPDTVEEARL